MATVSSGNMEEKRIFTGSRLVIATHNEGKAKEFANLLRPYVEDIVSAKTLGLPEPEENGTTFSENALIKAQAAAKASGEVALADDSGLCVSDLDDAPGLFSARWAGPEHDYKKAMQRVQDELGYKQNRNAHFMCILALAWPDGHAELVKGRVNGMIVWPPRGDGGFGYCPIFQPLGETRTFAEMSEEEKDAISHRGKAVQALIEQNFKKA